MYTKHYHRKATPQSEPIPGREAEMVANEAGRYVFQVDDWQRLDRFLILGTEGGTYYAQERALTRAAAQAVERCIRQDGPRVVQAVVAVSQGRRAPSNDPALFVLALCASADEGVTRRMALAWLDEVARTGTHLLTFLEYANSLRGWGRSLRQAVGRWYNGKPVGALAYQVLKYRQRGGWTHRDALRLAHPNAATELHNALYHYLTQGDAHENLAAIPLVEGYLRAQASETPADTAALIRAYGLVREMVQTEHLNDRAVWEALLEKMPVMALVRNLGKLGQIGILQPGAWDAIADVTGRLNEAAVRQAGVHPMSLLIAQHTYQQGKGMRGSLAWPVVPEVVDALDEAFYAAFANVEPSGQRLVVAVDCSGSMEHDVTGVYGLSCREAAAAMALVTVKTEPKTAVMGFTNRELDLPISPKDRLSTVMDTIRRVAKAEGTDCAIPMQWARKRAIDADAFLLYTDAQTWAGDRHPLQVLGAFRRSVGHPVKYVEAIMAFSGHSLADPDDRDALLLAGFDASGPQAISAFLSL